MRTSTWPSFGLAAIVLAWGGTAGGQTPVGTGFTYQGQLKQGGVPADGSADLRFTLWDAENGDSQLGSAVSIPLTGDKELINGLFTVELNADGAFSPDAFNGEARWLQIEVRMPAWDGAGKEPPFMTLAPRQKLTGVPYAHYAIDGGSEPLWQLTGSDIYYNDGNVGIGTITPSENLVVGEDLGGYAGNRIAVGDAAAGTTPGFMVGEDDSNRAWMVWSVNDNLLSFGMLNNNTRYGNTLVLKDGNVGVGTAEPTSKLHISSLGEATLTIEADTNDIGSETQNARIYLSQDGGAVTGRIGYRHGDNSLEIVNAYNDSLILGTNDTDAVTITAEGRVGIGTTEPTAKLEATLSGYGCTPDPPWVCYDWTNSARLVTSEYAVYGNAESPAGFAGYFEGRGYFRSNVGIGTPSPDVKLHIEGGTNCEPESGGYVVIGSISEKNIAIDNDEIMARENGAPATLYLNRNGHAVRVPVLEITGADLAEKFPVSEAVTPGTVVEIDPDRPGHLRVSRSAYTRRVAGVVSGANGLSVGAVLGNMPGYKDAPPIALSGRVWVHCDATEHPITPGDLLTTSATAGHAMKVSDPSRAQGAVLGKAMTPLSTGKGLVLTLVTLQ